MRKDRSDYRFAQTKRRRKPWLIVLAIIGLCITLLLVLYFHDTRRSDLQIGKELDSYKGVAVYYNGINGSQSHGKSYSDSGYYYGYKWQCVEYIKRLCGGNSTKRVR